MKSILRKIARQKWRAWYKQYLHSPQWKKKRKMAMGRDKWTCQRCGKKQCALEVHHKTYERVGKERLSDLVTLCKACHKKTHREKRRNRN